MHIHKQLVWMGRDTTVGGVPIKVGLQEDQLTCWYESGLGIPDHCVKILATGEEIKDGLDWWHLDTFPDGPYIWHAYVSCVES